MMTLISFIDEVCNSAINLRNADLSEKINQQFSQALTHSLYLNTIFTVHVDPMLHVKEIEGIILYILCMI